MWASTGPLPERVEVAAYYVASEALANAAKHAPPRSCGSRSRSATASCELAIRDDGVGGADPARARA